MSGSQGSEPRQRWSRGISLSARYLMCQWLQDTRRDGGCRKEATIFFGELRVCRTCAKDAARVSLDLREAADGLQEWLGEVVERP